MKRALSIVTFVLCCLMAAVFVFVAVTEILYAVTQDSEGWGAIIFRRLTGPAIAGEPSFWALFPAPFCLPRNVVDLIVPVFASPAPLWLL